MQAVIVNGVFVGLIYGLLGVGLVVVYRGSRVVNFAYGETGMLAAFVYADVRFGHSALSSSDRGLTIALPAALIVAVALGAATEVTVARPLRDAPRIRPLVGTFAVATLIDTFAVRRWGTGIRFTKPLIDGNGVRFLGVRIQPEQLLILAASIVLIGGLWALYNFTSFGLRLRATAMDPYAAGLTGVNVNRTSTATWAIAGALSGISALLIAPLVAFNVFFMTTLMIRGLAAALVGGLTSFSGAFTAGVLIGVAEGVIAYKSPVPGVTDAAVAGFVVLLMLVRPGGLVRASY